MNIGDNSKITSISSAVNGGIKVGKNCDLQGLSAVNGGIVIGEGTTVKGTVSSVNGSVICKETVQIAGTISASNGSIDCKPGVKVAGKVSTVNGKIHFRKTIGGSDLFTSNGNIALEDNSVLEGNITIHRKTKLFPGLRRPLTVLITGNSVVKGDIVNKGHFKSVKVIISNGGKVEGQIKNAQVE